MSERKRAKACGQIFVITKKDDYVALWLAILTNLPSQMHNKIYMKRKLICFIFSRLIWVSWLRIWNDAHIHTKKKDKTIYIAQMTTPVIIQERISFVLY